MAKRVVGQMESFDCDQGDNWLTYVECLEQYFVVNDITSGVKKAAVLLTVVGPKTYGLIRDLLAPDKPAEKSYAEIVAAMKEHLNQLSWNDTSFTKEFRRKESRWHNILLRCVSWLNIVNLEARRCVTS